MALIACRECHTTISDQAATCPRCGAPVRPPQPKLSFVTQAILWSIVVAGVIFFGAVLAAQHFLGGSGATRALAPAVKAPVTLKDEIVPVSATGARGLPIELPYSGDVTIEINVLRGEYVNVYVIDVEDWKQFEKARNAFFGGRFQHYPNFNATKARTYKRSGRLGEGTYYIVLENPTLGIFVASSFDVQVKAVLKP